MAVSVGRFLLSFNLFIFLGFYSFSPTFFNELFSILAQLLPLIVMYILLALRL